MIENEGTTLIESIIAMLILSMIVIGLNASVMSLIKSNKDSKDLTAAVATGNQLLEKSRRGNFDSIISDIDTIGIFIRTRYVTKPALANQAKIDLIVQWPKETKKHSINLATIVAKQ